MNNLICLIQMASNLLKMMKFITVFNPIFNSNEIIYISLVETNSNERNSCNKCFYRFLNYKKYTLISNYFNYIVVRFCNRILYRIYFV